MKIIAESAFNHNGDANYLNKLALAAKESKADYFTAQIYVTEEFCKKDYSRYSICEEAEISFKDWEKLFEYCKEIEIEMIPCVLDEKSFLFAYNYGYRFLKLHATDICNVPFLNKIAEHTDCEIILETQCATLFDIRQALDIIGDQVVCVMHGFSNYPTDYEDLNLNALDALKEEYRLPVGFADHSLDTANVPLMVLAKGAAYLEKHITLTRSLKNYDWQVSLNPEEFSCLVQNVKLYSKSLGTGVKHPVKSELQFRTIMYKKVENENSHVRKDEGYPYSEYRIKSFSRDNVIACVIARLKSHRLQKKVLLSFHSNSLIIDLIDRIETSKVSNTVLATSYLNEDAELAELAESNNKKTYRGHPLSVVDRMLHLVCEYESGAIFRITGDNPFTDPKLLDIMIDTLNKNDLDYVRVNNLPLGVSAELYSSSYLFNLYLKMENPLQSEYLAWFAINDKEAKKGCISFEHENKILKQLNLSVDYREDYDKCQNILKKVNKKKYTDFTLRDIIENVDLDIEDELDKPIKLPEGKEITFGAYLDLLDNIDYTVKLSLSLDEIDNW